MGKRNYLKVIFNNCTPFLVFLIRTQLTILLFISCKDEVIQPIPKPPGYQEDIQWPSLANSPWPMFQHDPQFTGRSEFRGPRNGNIVGEFSFNAIPEYSGIVISENEEIIFTTSNVFDSNTVSAFLYKLNKDLSVQWRTNLSLGKSAEMASKPLLDKEGNVYNGGYAGYFISNKNSGVENWIFDTGSIIHTGFTGSNLDKNGNIYFSTIQSLVVMNNSGNKLFDFPEYHSSPILFPPDGKIFYAIHNASSLDAVDLSGNILWSYPFNTYWSPIPLCDSQGNIYMSTNDSTFISINKSGNKRWEFHIDKNTGLPFSDYIDFYVASAIDKNGNILFRTGSYLYSVNYAGQLNWKSFFPDAAGSNIVIDAKGVIYTMTWGDATNEAKLYSISCRGKVNWELPIGVGYRCRGNSIAISSDGSLFILVNNGNGSNSISKILKIY